MSSWVVGQRFVSEAEPELGLGRVERFESRSVVLRFPASDTVRHYASVSAPIRRVAFRVGDEVEDSGGRRFRVEGVEERDGILFYRVGSRRVPETELSGGLTFGKPEDRLLAGLWDPSSRFDLRRRALENRHRIGSSAARGFLGARIELIPHQLGIASEIAGRSRPRALLADEVGLGKTIEAGLVVHRFLRSGQMRRVLVLVPEPLVHQWFVEMLRRFHLSFTIVDDRYCRETEAEQGANPFLLTQTAIASLPFVARNPERREQAQAAGWDMLVVDEAHHLAWSESNPSPEYSLVEAIAARTRGVLLLTATPEQLGEESHFARLSLLDPQRYRSYRRYLEDRKRYRSVAELAETVLDGKALTAHQAQKLGSILPRRAASLRGRLAALLAGDESARGPLLEALVDQHGPGRVVFRNAHRILDRFPERRLRAHRLDVLEDRLGHHEALEREFVSDVNESTPSRGHDYGSDLRAQWLADFLGEIAPEKVLVICGSKEKVAALQEALRHATTAPVALFHEGLSLLQRDRNAAWFASERDGARALLCSEIGSEGRNFQFARHLVLFDLPLSPELLEQRIGRLHRIGQERLVAIHVPCVAGSPQEMVLLWYRDGLDAFERSPPGGPVFEEIASRLRELALAWLEASGPGPAAAPAEELADLVRETRALREALSRELQAGRDRLLELSSFRPRQAESLIAEIRRWDEDTSLDAFIVDALDYLGLDVEEIAPRTYVLRQGSRLVVDAVPGLRSAEVGMTCDRDRATHQGELDFLTWDHPMVTGVIEILLGAEHGNCAVALLPSGEPGLLLEALFVLDCVAPPELFVSRFLPPTPLRVAVDHRLSDATADYPVDRLAGRLRDGRRQLRFRELAFLEDLVPRMLSKARSIAETEAELRIRASLAEMRGRLPRELDRLRSLAEVNDHVHPEEIERAESEMARLEEVMGAARPRLDALRLIRLGAEGA